MAMTNVIAALKEEIARLQQALALLEGTGTGKRRGRPPKSLSEAPTEKRARKPFSAATRKKMALAQKARWAAKKKAAAKS